MPRKLEPKEPVQKCTGGRSFNCRRDSHPVGKVADLYCWRCQTRMGCSSCAESAGNRVCLICRDWATKTGLEIHGAMIKDPVIGRQALKIVMMVNNGQITVQESNQLFSELWKIV